MNKRSYRGKAVVHSDPEVLGTNLPTGTKRQARAAPGQGKAEQERIIRARLRAKPGIRWGMGRLTLNFKPAKLRPGKTPSEIILEERR